MLLLNRSGGEFSLRVVTRGERCKSRPVLFTLLNKSSSDPLEYIELHRCMGFDKEFPPNYRCVNITTNTMTVRLGSREEIRFNHSECAMKCVCEGGKYPSHCLTPKAHHSDIFCYTLFFL